MPDDDKPPLTLEEFNRRVLSGTVSILANNLLAAEANPLYRQLMESLPEPTRWQRLTVPFRRFWRRCEAAWEAFRDV